MRVYQVKIFLTVGMNSAAGLYEDWVNENPAIEIISVNSNDSLTHIVVTYKIEEYLANK